MKIRFSLIVVLAFSIVVSAQYKPDLSIVQKIKHEGIQNSNVMEYMSVLTDEIGPRLSNSPGIIKAYDWAKKELENIGLKNVKLESWGTFGRGWSLKKFSLEMTKPQYLPLNAFPKAWVKGTAGIVNSEAVLIDIKKEDELNKFKDKLEGKIILLGNEVVTKPHFEADAERLSEEELENLIKAREPAVRSDRASRWAAYRARRNLMRKVVKFLKNEKIAAILQPSRGDDGTIFVQGGGSYKMNGEPGLPQVVVSVEQYSRMVRLLKRDVEVALSLNLEVEFHDQDSLGYNVVAEIPGTDRKLKSQIVMLGGHIDSWHAGTGATDDASGCAVTMEAVRILKALNLKPRRTIKIALWGSEEQGLYGSRGFAKKHLADRKTMELKSEHSKVSVYFNYDNGTGKIRGIYAQSNDAAKPIFEEWLKPFNDMGATAVTLRNTGSTDHIAFDEVGVPGFQFIQDNIDYYSRTHHSNMDVLDNAVASDLIQSSVIMASFIYNAAMMDKMFPRKPLPTKK